ncbi:hypothetical protein DW1_1610 [Proteiniborus sp. DW1]|uniref:endolytic transglycosylase MltG n=1 Tax=Proteiniborus sp. DW1 TaxID=1889883 RepID=UPI00092DF230|nr:endolytic transglycosylase MltG [Proteiniborus sp. DW1]SCG83180.1 hypothetical protein DW1_1610 [Proteiniborus sp. DW1]
MDMNKMNKFFVVLGIGIGLLVSSLLNIAYPKIKYIDYSEAQIIEKAKELGMVSLKEVISMNEKKSAETALTKEDTNLIKEEPHPIEFVINKGENSEQIVDKLFEKGIIKDKKEFTDKIIEEGLQKRFKYGIYELEPEMDYESLIKVLMGK